MGHHHSAPRHVCSSSYNGITVWKGRRIRSWRAEKRAVWPQSRGNRGWGGRRRSLHLSHQVGREDAGVRPWRGHAASVQSSCGPPTMRILGQDASLPRVADPSPTRVMACSSGHNVTVPKATALRLVFTLSQCDGINSHGRSCRPPIAPSLVFPPGPVPGAT